MSDSSSNAALQSDPLVFVFVCAFQTDSGCAVPVPSLHCQRIARAKWEFLFGTPAEEAASRGEKSERMSSSISSSHCTSVSVLYQGGGFIHSSRDDMSVPESQCGLSVSVI